MTIENVTLEESVRRGDTWQGFTLQILNGGAPLNLTGYLVRMQVRLWRSAPPIMDVTRGSGISVTDLTGQISIDPKLLDVEEGLYMFDVECTSPGGVVTTFLKGTLLVHNDVTHV